MKGLLQAKRVAANMLKNSSDVQFNKLEVRV